MLCVRTYCVYDDWWPLLCVRLVLVLVPSCQWHGGWHSGCRSRAVLCTKFAGSIINIHTHLYTYIYIYIHIDAVICSTYFFLGGGI